MIWTSEDGNVEIQLRMTCYACPEQYDAIIAGEEVAYLRLRHGYFMVQVPWGGETVYEADPEGDGIFEVHEREKYLSEACRRIAVHLGLIPASDAKTVLQKLLDDVPSSKRRDFLQDLRNVIEVELREM